MASKQTQTPGPEGGGSYVSIILRCCDFFIGLKMKGWSGIKAQAQVRQTGQAANSLVS